MAMALVLYSIRIYIHPPFTPKFVVDDYIMTVAAVSILDGQRLGLSR